MGRVVLRSDRLAPAAGLEAALQRMEQHLDDLQASIGARDLSGIESHAAELQRSLAQTLADFPQATRQGGPPLSLRRRLGLASAQVAAQRDALARAGAALERAIAVLMPGTALTVYSASGNPQHPRSGASLQA